MAWSGNNGNKLLLKNSMFLIIIIVLCNIRSGEGQFGGPRRFPTPEECYQACEKEVKVCEQMCSVGPVGKDYCTGHCAPVNASCIKEYHCDTMTLSPPPAPPPPPSPPPPPPPPFSPPPLSPRDQCFETCTRLQKTCDGSILSKTNACIGLGKRCASLNGCDKIPQPPPPSPPSPPPADFCLKYCEDTQRRCQYPNPPCFGFSNYEQCVADLKCRDGKRASVEDCEFDCRDRNRKCKDWYCQPVEGASKWKNVRECKSRCDEDMKNCYGHCDRKT